MWGLGLGVGSLFFPTLWMMGDLCKKNYTESKIQKEKKRVVCWKNPVDYKPRLADTFPSQHFLMRGIYLTSRMVPTTAEFA